MITTISQLVAQVESNGRNDALRFEPAYHPDTRALPLIKAAWPGLSFQTYEMVLASSWGQYQIMGDNLYLLGLKVSLLSYSRDGLLQTTMFYKFLAARGINYTLEDVLEDQLKRENFARHYNGNAVGYAQRMMQVYEQLKGQSA